MVAKLFFALSLLVVAPLAISGNDGFRASLIRTGKSLDRSLAAERSRHRLSTLMSRVAASTNDVAAQTPLKKGEGDYVMEFGIGTPALTVEAEADTGSNLVWVKCSPCNFCNPRPTTLYDPAASSTFSRLPCQSALCEALPKSSVTCNATKCRYHYSYGVDRTDLHHYTQGVLGTETFTLGQDAMPGVGFGSSDTVEGNFGKSSGLVGLGRGRLSLVSQLGAGVFSYCLTTDPSTPSPLMFGSLAKPTPNRNFSSTPLITDPTFYYVNLLGISVGGNLVSLPKGTFNIATTTGAGSRVIFDSGTTLTLLAEPGYGLVKEAIISHMAQYKQIDGAPYSRDVCFQVDAATVRYPGMVMHFEGADMSLEWYNYFQFMDERRTVLCSAVNSSPSLSIIGNVMQMNYQVVYDLQNSKLSFRRTDCSKI